MPGQEVISILLIDANDASRYALARMLLRAGYQIVEATGSEQAFRLASEKPDLILLSAALPRCGEVCREIKSSPATSFIPLGLVCDEAFSHDCIPNSDSLADGFFFEPLEFSVVVATVRTMLRMHTAEERARTLSSQWQATFDAISDGIWLLDLNGHVVRCNLALERCLSLAPAEARGHHATQFVQEVGDLLPRAYRSTPRDEIAVIEDREITLGTAWYLVSTNLIEAGTGAPIGVVQVFRDITEQKKIEAARAEVLLQEQIARRELEIASRMKDDFLATLSHELRTPLHTMLGWLDMLRKNEVPPEKIEDALATVERGALSQVEIINDLLDVSRAITGKIYLELEPLDLVQSVASSMEAFTPQAKSKSIALEAELGEQEMMINGDAGRLRQIVSNLLSNAIKFTPNGGHVAVRLSRGENDARLEIVDSGRGITPHFLPHVFERFRQADSTSTRSQGGLGLGLAIVRHLTEAQGGTIEACSAGIDQGATFTVTFPLLKEIASSESTPLDEETTEEILHGMRLEIEGAFHEASDAPPTRTDDTALESPIRASRFRARI